MGERVLCKHEVIGSIPFTSTNFQENKILGSRRIQNKEKFFFVFSWFLNKKPGRMIFNIVNKVKIKNYGTGLFPKFYI